MLSNHMLEMKFLQQSNQGFTITIMKNRKDLDTKFLQEIIIVLIFLMITLKLIIKLK